MKDAYKTYLLKHWSSLFSKSFTLNELCGKLSNEFPGLNRVSISKISRTLKEDLYMDFHKLWSVSSKMKDMKEISKLAKSALLLKNTRRFKA